MIKLVMLNSKLNGKVIAVKKAITFGSDDSCKITVDHEVMKPHHASLDIDEDNQPTIAVDDPEALLIVNGQPVQKQLLRNGDMIKIGPLRFKVVIEEQISMSALKVDQLFEDFEVNKGQEVLDFATEDLFYLSTKDPSLREAVSFRIPSKDRFIEQAQVFLSRLVHQSGMDEMKVEAFMTCTKELILNAHRHGHQYDESKFIIVRYRDNGSSLTLTIEDQGPGFDHHTAVTAARSVDAAQAARERYKAGGFGGLGFQLICRMSDDLHYNDAGNAVTFTVDKDFG
jgi:anti-sigma regulatory factor (Ser/Thr protein kinase)